MDHASLSRWNVPKLKEKCKELKITGYSKLSKPLLIEKLLDFASEVDAGLVDSSAAAELQASSPESRNLSTNKVSNNIPDALGQVQRAGEPNQQWVEGLIVESVATMKKRARNNNNDNKERAKKVKKVVRTTTNNPALRVSRNNDTTQEGPVLLQDTSNHNNTISNAHISRGTHGNTYPSVSSSAKNIMINPTYHTSLTLPQLLARTDTQATEIIYSIPIAITRKSKNLPSLPNSILATTRPRIPSPHHLSNQTQNDESAPQTLPQRTPIPLVTARNPEIYKPKTFKPPAILRPPRTTAKHNPKPAAPEPVPCSDKSLDFPSPELWNSFPLISMPPSTARRRQAERMSVVFSGIVDDEVLGLCVKVSRAWRYAVYLSATHVLYREFPGARLDSIRLQIKEPRMTNMWAYLRARRLETSTRYNAFQGSWLGRFFVSEMSGREPISWRIWASPDHDCQITVALRFISTRVVFSLARRYSECDQSWVNLTEKVVGAEEIVPGEIWKVTTSSASEKLKSFHVLYDTGEVIGLAPTSPRCGIIGQRIKHRPHIELLDSEPGELRADWREYILLAGSGPNLQDSITNGDRDSYVAGVSTCWLQSLGLGLEDQEPTRKAIARRYILACVEPNSVSGEYKSVMEMAGDVAGVTSHDANRESKHQVGLFVSEHHLVESVHIPGSLHPALAVVVTAPGREYFVLRDTGIPIGTSDQGLEPLWQRLIGCDAWGNRCAYTARAIG